MSITSTPATEPAPAATAAVAAETGPTPAENAARPANESAATAPAASLDSPLPDEQDELDEQAHHFGRFVLFSAVPSSLISGVVHFVLFVVLALTHMSPPPVKKMLQLNVA